MVKRLWLLLSLFGLSGSVFAAHAMLVNIDDAQMSNPPNITWFTTVVFTGSDVPGTFETESILFSVAGTVTPSQLAATAAAAIRAQATAEGFTVSTGAILLPNYTTQ